MGYCGLPEEGRRGENYRNGMVHGRQYTVAFGNGGLWVFSRRSFRLCQSTLTLRISQSTQPPARCIKAPTVGKKTGDKAVGVSRGGRNTKIHALVDGLGNPLAFLLSSGNDHDSKHAVPLLSQINIEESNILGDKAYGARAIRDYIESQNAAYTIPPKSHVHNPWPVDWHTYKERHLVECFFQKLKWFRRVFTRYDKLDSSFLSFVHIAAIAILLK